MTDLTPFHADASSYLDIDKEAAGLAWANDPANRAFLDHWVNHAVYRALSQLENTGYDIDIRNIGPTSVDVKLSWDDYCRGCHMGTYSQTVTFTFAELLHPDTQIRALAEERYEAAEHAEKMRKAAEEAHRRKAELERTRPAREAAERAKLAELKAKYPDQS